VRAIAWDDRALTDLEAIGEYIARDNRAAAKRVVEYIVKTAHALQSMPFLGVEVDADLREFVLTRFPYVLSYEVTDDEVRILAIFHQNQNRR